MNRTYVQHGDYMSFDDYDIIEKMVQQMRQESDELDNKISYNLQSIKEADVYANLLLSSESEDFRIFSPRNPGDMQKSEIKKAYQEKENCEKENQQLYSRRDLLAEQLKGLERILKHKNDGLVALNMQEEDRQRIARDLHDTSLQNLTHLIHKIELSSLYIDEDAIKAKLELAVINKILKKTIDEIRNTIFDLRPMTFDDLGFKEAVERLLANINENRKYIIETDIEDVSCENNLILVSAYRVIQECLNNIDKHAEAEKIIFSCKNYNNKCIIMIQDDGKGFDVEGLPEGNHFGLSLMRERINLINGKLQITSKNKEGTSIQIEVPLDK